jgi:hypothetical protein
MGARTMNKKKQFLEEDAAKTYNQFKVFEGRKYTGRIAPEREN